MRTREASSGSSSVCGACERGERVSRERLAEHGRVLEHAPLLGGQAVEPGCDQRVQRLRHFERADLADRQVDRPFLHEQAAVEQHPHRLDRVQRHTLGAREDLLAQRRRKTGHEPDQQLLHRGGGQRLEVERAEVALAGAPARPALEQLRACERDHVERRVARPLEQVLDEVEQALVRPLHVLEREHRRIDVGEPLEEQPPRREQILPVARLLLGQAEQLRDARLDEAALLGVGDVLLERRAQLLRAPTPALRPRRSGSAFAPCRRAPSR